LESIAVLCAENDERLDKVLADAEWCLLYLDDRSWSSTAQEHADGRNWPSRADAAFRFGA